MFSTRMFHFFRYVSMAVIVLFLGACSSGGDDSSTDNPSATKQGVFLNIEGVEYTAGGQSGITGAGGSFSYEGGATIKLYLGGILIGEIPSQAVITTVDLVSGATDETNIVVINIYRFLLSLDSDGDFSNGVQIDATTRSRAVGQTLDFTLSETVFEANAKTVVADLVNSSSPDSVLISSQLAQSELRGDLLGLYIGYYAGTFMGDDTGTWSLTVDANGVISGEGFSNNDNAAFTLAGTTSSDGGGDVSAGSVSTGATFSGTFTRDGVFSGTWQNTQFNESGTFTGNKTTPPNNNPGNGGVDTGGTVTTNPDLQAGVAIYNTVTANFANYESADMTILAPQIAENGAVVPLTVNFPSNTGTLWLFMDRNSEKVAAKVDFVVADNNGFFSTRIKMKETGNIIAVFESNNGSLMAAKQQVMVSIGAEPVTCVAVDCAPVIDPTNVRLRDNAGTFKMLVSNEMSIEDHITSITIAFNNQTIAVVYLTPFIAKNPYLSVKHGVSVGAEVSATVEATGNRSVTQTIISQ